MFPFTIRQLEVFLTVCEAKSFRLASDELRITQAGVSNHIKALEEQLGLVMFERNRGSIANLSEAGLRFWEIAVEIRTIVEKFTAETRAAKSILRVVVGDHILANSIKPVLADFYIRNPNIEIDFVQPYNYSTFDEIMDDQSIDCALIAWGNIGESYLNTECISYVPGGVYALQEIAESFNSNTHRGLAIIAWPLDKNAELHTLQDIQALGIENAFVAKRVQHFDDAIELALRGVGAVLVRESMGTAIDKDHKLILISRPISWGQLLYISPALKKEHQMMLSSFLKTAVLQAQT